MLKYKLYTVYVSSHGTLESRYRLCISGDLSRPTCVSLPRLSRIPHTVLSDASCHGWGWRRPRVPRVVSPSKVS